MRRTLGYLGLVVTLASALLLGASKLMPRMDAARWADAAETTGQIVGFSESGSSRRPLVCFVASNGDPYIFEADTYNPAMGQGQIVTVRYFLEPQLQASLRTDFASYEFWLGIAGCVLAAAGLLLLLLQMRRSSLSRQLVLYGTRLEATVTSIHMVRIVRLKSRLPYTITCTLRSPQGIGEWIVKSGWIWKLPPSLRVGGTVPVMVDMYRPSRYRVLVEEAMPAPTPSDAVP